MNTLDRIFETAVIHPLQINYDQVSQNAIVVFDVSESAIIVSICNDLSESTRPERV